MPLMIESRSKLLVLAEAVLFLAPVTLLTIWYSILLVGLYWYGLADAPAGAHVAPAFTFIGLIIQIFAWWAVAVFLFRGRLGLSKLNSACVFAIYIGAVLVIVGGLSVMLNYIFKTSTTLNISAFGLPALIPFGHIALEHRRATSNNSFKPTPLRGAA